MFALQQVHSCDGQDVPAAPASISAVEPKSQVEHTMRKQPEDRSSRRLEVGQRCGLELFATVKRIVHVVWRNFRFHVSLGLRHGFIIASTSSSSTCLSSPQIKLIAVIKIPMVWFMFLREDSFRRAVNFLTSFKHGVLVAS